MASNGSIWIFRVRCMNCVPFLWCRKICPLTVTLSIACYRIIFHWPIIFKRSVSPLNGSFVWEKGLLGLCLFFLFIANWQKQGALLSLDSGIWRSNMLLQQRLAGAKKTVEPLLHCIFWTSDTLFLTSIQQKMNFAQSAIRDERC